MINITYFFRLNKCLSGIDFFIMHEINIKIKNDLSELDKVFSKLQTFSDNNNLDKKIIFNLHLALDDILNNIISYGYTDTKSHFIYITIKNSKRSVRLSIKDDSQKWNLTKKSDPDITKSIGEKKIGGLGIYLIKNLFDTVDYKRKNGKNLLSLEINNYGNQKPERN